MKFRYKGIKNISDYQLFIRLSYPELGYYYNTDHLGNVREVIDEKGDVVQITNYYPFGTPYSAEDCATHNPDQQNHKYNGKEFDTTHGLNTYDYGARQYNSLLGRWDRMDPLCEIHPGISPYAYCANNPISFIDPDGCDSLYYSERGEQLHHYGIDDSKTLVFVVKTTLTTKDIKETGKMNQDGFTTPISKESAQYTEQQLRNGNLSGSHMNNITCFGTTGNIKSALKAIKDDGSHGLSPANNREYCGDYTENGVKNTRVGPVGNPTKERNLPSYGPSDWHSHASGRNGSYGWQSAPTRQDINTVRNGRSEYVYSMDNGLIYKYNKGQGVIATLPIKIFK